MPGAVGHLTHAEMCAVLSVKTPPDSARRGPLLQTREVVAFESETSADRLSIGDVEHVRCRDAPCHQREQARYKREHGIRLTERPVRQPHAQPGRSNGRRGDDVRAFVTGVDKGLAHPERRLNKRCERLDVGAHDDDVARLERWVVLEGMKDRVAQDLDLARTAVAGVNLDAVIVVCEGGARVRGARPRARWRLIGPQARLELGEQTAAFRPRRMMGIGSPRRAFAHEEKLKLACVSSP